MLIFDLKSVLRKWEAPPSFKEEIAHEFRKNHFRPIDGFSFVLRFHQCVQHYNYNGNYKIKSFSCWSRKSYITWERFNSLKQAFPLQRPTRFPIPPPPSEEEVGLLYNVIQFERWIFMVILIQNFVSSFSISCYMFLFPPEN